MYHKLAGMTGTASTEAGEFWDIYKLDVVEIPTNKPVIRDDMDDRIYKTAREKYKAVIEEVVRLRNAGRPTLIGTTSVEISELLSRMLDMYVNPETGKREGILPSPSLPTWQVVVPISSCRLRSRLPVVWPSSAQNVMSHVVSTASYVVVPDVRVTQVRHCSSSHLRTSSCVCSALSALLP